MVQEHDLAKEGKKMQPMKQGKKQEECLGTKVKIRRVF